MITQEIRRQCSFTLPPMIANEYELQKLSKYAGRLFTKVWRSIMRASTVTACWFSDDQISRHGRIPLELVKEAQAECLQAGFLVIRPGGCNQQKYMLGDRAIGLVDPTVMRKYRRQ